MAKRLSAKEIKHDIREDEVQTFLARVFLALEEHPRIVFGSIAGVIVLALLASGTYAYLNNRQQAAVGQLAEAIETYSAPIDEEGATPDDPDSPTFAREEERRRARAKDAFGEIRGGISGNLAELFLADIALSEGDTEGARKIWQGFLENHKDHILALSVRLNLIRLDRETDRAAEVATELEQELEKADKKLPEDVILFELAQTREALEDNEVALELYQRILDEYPQSPYAGTARQMTTSAGS